MKKIKKKLFAYIATFLMVASNITLPQTIKAANAKVTVADKIPYSFQVTDKDGHMVWGAETEHIYADGEVAFCVQPGQLVNENASYSISEFKRSERKAIEQIAYVGWQLSNKTNEDYLATQFMIWETLGATINSTSYSGYNVKKAAIQKQIDSMFSKSPSFNGVTKTLKPGETITLTDTNGVFKYYSLTSKSTGITVSSDGNKLTISATKDTPENAIIKYQLIKKSFVGTTMVYSSTTSQDVVTTKHKDPGTITINLNVEKHGSLKITKQDEDGTAVPNTSFKLSKNADMSSPVGTYTTGSNGSVTVNDLESTLYYVQETAVPNHLVLDSTIRTVNVEANKTVTYTAQNNWVKGKILLKKTDEENGQQVGGATYAIYNDAGQELQRLVTTATGDVESGYLRFGHYTVKEVIAPEGFVLNDTVYDVDVTSNEQRITVTGTDRPIKGYIQVVKKDADTGQSVTVSNAVFSIYKKDGTYVQDITTDGNGVAKTNLLRYGDYYLQEKSAPDKYTHNNQQIIYEIREDGKTYAAEFSNKRTIGSINIIKEDNVTGSTPQGEATLQGAIYELKAKNPILNPADNSVVFAKDAVVSTLTTDEYGKASVENLYLGDYYLQEKTPSNGYTLDTSTYDVSLTYNNQNETVVTKTETVKERVISQAFSIIKISDNGSGEADNLKGVEFTIKAQKDIDAAGSWEKAPVAKNAQGTTASVLVTDDKGYALSEELPYGSYVIRETKVPADHYAVPDFKVVIDKDSRDPQPWRIFNDQKFKAVIAIVKKDAETGKTVALPGAEFKIKNLKTNQYVGSWVWNPLPHYVDSWTTDESGQVMTDNVLDPGEYQLEEVKAPEGYTLNVAPIKFKVSSDTAYETLPDGSTPVITIIKENTSVKGKINVSKKGEVLTGVAKDENGNLKFEYDVRNLPDAVFEVYAKEDIYSADNQKDLIYHKDDLVETLTTGTDGLATSKSLPLGNYYVKEKTAPEGFVHSEIIKDIKLTYADQNTSIVFDNAEYQNQRQRVQVKVNKKDEENKTPLSGAVFGLYSKEDINGHDGSKLVSKDTLIETETSNLQGLVQFKADLPLSKFYIKEISAPIGYASSNKILDVDASYQGQDIAVIKYEQDFENSITKFEVSKKDITDDTEIEGAHLTVYPKDEPGAVFDTWISGQDGKNEDGTIKPHLIKGLEPGKTYVLHETSSPYGFAIAQDVEFIVKDTGDIQSVEMKDEIVMGQLKWNKTGEIFMRTITGQTEFGKTETPVWDESNLLGSEITIYAATDIKIGNNTYFKADEAVETLESDWDAVLSKKLPVGRYYYRETKVPHGYLTDTNKYYFEIEDNQVTDLQTISSTLKNDRPTVDIDMTKVMEKQETFENLDAYQNVLFGIFAREDIYDYKGNVAIENGTLISTTGISKEAHLVSVPDLPNGVYYIKELATDKQYVLSDKEYDFEIAYHGPDVAKYIVQIGTEGKIENELARGSIHVKKTDSYDETLNLKDIKFNISTDSDMKNIITTVTTNAEGIASFTDLELGTYYIQEAEQVDGYIVNDHIYKADVTVDGDILQIDCENKPTEMIFSKKGETGTDELEGAKLQVTEKETGKVIDEWTSTKEEHIIRYLVEGKEYVMTEISAPYGYEIAEAIVFTAKDGNKVTMKDKMIRSYVKVNKVDFYDQKSILKEAEFTLYSDPECKKEIRKEKTDPKTGIAIFDNLTFGTVYIKETKAPAGYQLSKEVVKVTIDDKWVNGNDKLRTIVFPDMPLPAKVISKHPQTGDTTSVALLLGILLVSGTCAVLIRRKKKTSK